MTTALVVGYGSIGQRHARLLRDLGCEVAVVSRREIDSVQRFSSIPEALSATKPNYIVIANETSGHAPAIEEVHRAGFSGKVLVEKPLGAVPIGYRHSFKIAAVGYNLRFHPALKALRDAIKNEQVVSIQIYCGQYLPDWRPGTDYRESYSADPARGGGVLRDLSHELDYLVWLGGAWRRVAAIGGRLGELDIQSDDSWGLLVELAECPLATVQINYLDRPGNRKIVVNTSAHTYRTDLIAATLECDGKMQKFEIDRHETYLAQHRAVLSGDISQLSSFADGMRVMQFIDAIERSARERVWISA